MTSLGRVRSESGNARDESGNIRKQANTSQDQEGLECRVWGLRPFLHTRKRALPDSGRGVSERALSSVAQSIHSLHGTEGLELRVHGVRMSAWEVLGVTVGFGV